MNEPSALKALSRKIKLPAEESSPILLCTVELPQLEEDKKFNRFYEEICNNCVSFCQKALIKKCKSLQNGNELHTYAYRIRHRTTQENGFLTVTLTVSLSDKTAGKILYSHKETHNWKLQGKRYVLYREKRRKAQ